MAVTNSVEAYEYEIKAVSAFSKHDHPTAIELAKKAIKKDSGFVHAYLLLANSYLMHDKQLFDEVINRVKELPLNEEQSLWLQFFITYEPTPVKQLLELNEKQPIPHRVLGEDYLRKKDYVNAIKHLTRAIEIYDEWDAKPFWSQFYTSLGDAYHNAGMFRKEMKVYRKAERDFPGDPAVLTHRANFYNATNKIDLAEKYYHKAFASNPTDLSMKFNLSKFLISNDRDIVNALEQIAPLLEKYPEAIQLLELKGLGLYKLKKYDESLKYLYMCRDQRILKKQTSSDADELIDEVKRAMVK